MKLSSKILYCRKKAGLSQEALADIIGVSRQAISKWETEDALPEISKLLLLAKAFHVTTDWLLSEEEETEPEQPTSEYGTASSKPSMQESVNWVDSIPGVIGKLIRRYGWLFGVYTAIVGFFMTMMGGMARVITHQMFSGDMSGGFGAGTMWYDSDNNEIPSPFGSLADHNPVATMGTFIMVIGIVLMIAGVVLAIYLKKRSNDDHSGF